MDQLHLMRVYVAVAEEQGFAAAARRLKMSPPAVTRAISTLEDSLGIKLLTRTTRFVRTTEAGARYLEDVRLIIQNVEIANEAAIGIHAKPSGHLTVTAPVLFGEKYVMPGIVDYLNTYPETRVDAIFLDRVVNLLEEGFDVGIRIGHLPDSGMHAKVVGHVRLKLVATQDYLDKNGIPQSPDDLAEHTLIASSAGNMGHDWHFDHQGKKQSIRIHARLNVTTNQAAINAAKQGIGITRVISYQVAQALEQGTLKSVLSNYEQPAMPVHIIHREGRMASNKVRSFIDLMAQKLRHDKRLNAA